MKIDCQLFFADDTHLYTDVNPIHQSQIYSFEICISDMAQSNLQGTKDKTEILVIGCERAESKTVLWFYHLGTSHLLKVCCMWLRLNLVAT